MVSMRSISASCVLFLLVASGGGADLLQGEPLIDLTDHFAVSATSTCGDPPTLFEWPKNSGHFEVCSGSDYSIENVADGNASTRWQSVNGESSVDVTFTVNQVGIKLCSRKLKCIFPLFPCSLAFR